MYRRQKKKTVRKNEKKIWRKIKKQQTFWGNVTSKISLTTLATKYEHSHYKQTHTHSNRAFVTEVIVVVGFVFVVVVADIYAKTR